MNTKLTSLLCCPVDRSVLRLESLNDRTLGNGEKVIIDGWLLCEACHQKFPIIDEIAFIAEIELLDRIEPVRRFWTERGAIPQRVQSTSQSGNALLREVQTFWSDRPTAGKWDTDEEQMEGLERWRRESHPWLESFAGYERHSAQLMLEVGCGQGLCTYRFAENGANVVALDLSFDSIVLAQKRLRRKGLSDKVDLVLGNAQSLPFLDDRFDFVYSFGVIHHSPDTAACVREIARVVKSGSFVLVMYYYTWSLTKLIEASARLANRVLTWVTGDEQAFLKLARRMLGGYADKHTAQFLKTGKAATLHAPVIHTYSRRQTLAMFTAAGFTNIQFALTHLSEEVAFVLSKLRMSSLIPILARRVGWDLITTATKRG
ncbi:methyltransferase domain-containing protein [bacterium]|nr:MAG: methyltransferase domain-containing protein [bacterium]